MTKEKLNKAKELECAISFIKNEIESLGRLAKYSPGIIVCKSENMGQRDEVLRNCYGMFDEYFKQYKKVLESRLKELEKEFEEL